MIKNLLIFFLLCLPSFSFAYECNKDIDQISKEYEVKIFCRAPTDKFIHRWTISGNPPSQNHLNSFYPYLNRFFKFYSKNFVKNHITNIFLLEDLRLDNYSVGGLSNGYDMWLKVKQYHGEYYDFNLVVLHHEFSSNILKRNYQNIRKWSVFSEDYYGADESKSLGDFEYSRSGDHLTYAQGFVCNYGRVDYENDFNTYAELLFTNPRKIHNLARQYPIINKKLSKLKEIYISEGYNQKFPDEDLTD